MCGCNEYMLVDMDLMNMTVKYYCLSCKETFEEPISEEELEPLNEE